MRILGGIILALIAVFCGGCSLLFGYSDLTGQGLGVAMIWVPGLAIAAGSSWGAFRLLSSTQSSANLQPSDPTAAKDATKPEKPDNAS
jgi:hypothetical protein